VSSHAWDEGARRNAFPGRRATPALSTLYVPRRYLGDEPARLGRVVLVEREVPDHDLLPPGDTADAGAEGNGGSTASGDDTAQLSAELYDDLRGIARRLLRGEREGHTLDTTGLVHEAFLRLVGRRDESWSNRNYFLGAAAQSMRRLLVEYARERGAAKRDGGVRITLASLLPADDVGGRGTLDMLALDDALARLAAMDERQSRVVELRVFGGFDVDETAAILEISPATVKRDWRFAKAWLACELTDRDP
jgi:RNA polymerase sigma-70 factor (ECF subfamily)